ncbi:LuxR C-terminal-related transcriptional regulator [Eisenbergiella tayi]
MAKGKYNKEIAVELGITYGRTRNLVSAVYRKLGAVDRADLIAKLEKG